MNIERNVVKRKSKAVVNNTNLHDPEYLRKLSLHTLEKKSAAINELSDNIEKNIDALLFLAYQPKKDLEGKAIDPGDVEMGQIVFPNLVNRKLKNLANKLSIFQDEINNSDDNQDSLGHSIKGYFYQEAYKPKEQEPDAHVQEGLAKEEFVAAPMEAPTLPDKKYLNEDGSIAKEAKGPVVTDEGFGESGDEDWGQPEIE